MEQEYLDVTITVSTNENILWRAYCTQTVQEAADLATAGILGLAMHGVQLADILKLAEEAALISDATVAMVLREIDTIDNSEHFEVN